MVGATELIVAVKHIETPDERHAFGHASVNVVHLPGATITRTVYQPGWKWSTDVKPVVGTEACQAAHTRYIISGRLHRDHWKIAHYMDQQMPEQQEGAAPASS